MATIPPCSSGWKHHFGTHLYMSRAASPFVRLCNLCSVCCLSSKYLIMNDQYSRWDRRNQGKKNRRGVSSMQLGLFTMLVILLYSVLYLISMAVSQVEGEKRGPT